MYIMAVCVLAYRRNAHSTSHQMRVRPGRVRTELMAAASLELVVIREVPVSMMAPSARMAGTIVLPTATPSRATIQYLQNTCVRCQASSAHSQCQPSQQCCQLLPAQQPQELTARGLLVANAYHPPNKNPPINNHQM